jgi:GNAT superfamily N-acetyltransferase
MVVVHPKYWRRGHGSHLVRWGIGLADIDQVKQGVFATAMGAKLFLALGFQKIKDVHVEGDMEDPKGISLAIAKYEPEQGKAGKHWYWAVPGFSYWPYPSWAPVPLARLCYH